MGVRLFDFDPDPDPDFDFDFDFDLAVRWLGESGEEGHIRVRAVMPDCSCHCPGSGVRVHSGMWYRADPDLIIIETGPDWPSPSDAVIGKSLLDFISGPTARQVSEGLFRRALQHERTIRVPFRCDLSDRRRWMELVIAPQGHTVQVTSTTTAEQVRPSLRLLEATAPRSSDVVTMCSWCMRLVVDDEWVALEEAVRQLDLFTVPEQPRLSHGICADCEHRLLAE